jgi:hypothetical protein
LIKTQVGPFLEKSLGEFDFSEEVLFRVHLLLQEYGSDIQDHLDPLNNNEDENPAEMNLTFFLYLIKDVLEYNGFYPQSSPARQLKTAVYKIETLTLKAEVLSRAIA